MRERGEREWEGGGERERDKERERGRESREGISSTVLHYNMHAT